MVAILLCSCWILMLGDPSVVVGFIALAAVMVVAPAGIEFEPISLIGIVVPPGPWISTICPNPPVINI
jgi:hypothetical protein